MGAIKYKCMPIHFDKTNEVLYMESIGSFNDVDFIFLKRNENTLIPSSHMIDLSDGNIADNSHALPGLVNLILDIKKLALSDEILFGYPTELSLVGGNSFNYPEELNKPKKIFNANFAKMKSVKFKSFITDGNSLDMTDSATAHNITSQQIYNFDVGHGLSVYDKGSKLLFDCGGSIDRNIYLQKIKSIINTDSFSIVITHFHLDHYSYLNDILDDPSLGPQVQKIIVSKHFMITDSIETKFGAYFNKFYVLIHKDQLCHNYTFTLSEKNYKNQNRNSIVAFSDANFITGDKPYQMFEQTAISIKQIEYFQVPHHGSLSKGYYGTGVPSGPLCKCLDKSKKY